MSEEIITKWSREDRDLLVELKTEMRAVRSDVKDIKEGLASRVAALEATKMDKTEAVRLIEEGKNGDTKIFEDHEKRLRNVESSNEKFQSKVQAWGAAAILVLGIAQFVLQLYLSK